MANQNLEENNVIEFETSGVWPASSFCAFVNAIERSYRTLVLVGHISRSASEERERFLMRQEEMWHDFRRLSPQHFEEWEMMAERMYKMWRHSGRRMPPMFPWMPAGAMPWAETTPSETGGTDVRWLLTRLDEMIPASEDLFIHRIEMASPGGVSFKGLGEPLHQLRELVKDLWYRNRQEKERGELEILKEKIELFSNHGLPAQQVFVLAITMSEDLQNIRELIESGNLALGGEERRPLDTPRGTKRVRRPRRPKEDK